MIEDINRVDIVTIIDYWSELNYFIFIIIILIKTITPWQ
jgi:hypothetical protein